jgi:hypothetical protein
MATHVRQSNGSLAAGEAQLMLYQRSSPGKGTKNRNNTVARTPDGGSIIAEMKIPLGPRPKGTFLVEGPAAKPLVLVASHDLPAEIRLAPS